jgi:O-antigen/teichoic acid export membrane protein
VNDRAASKRLLGWLGWAGADAFGRLFLLSGATVIFSWLLDPEAFGISAIVLATAAAAGLLVGAPFQDALTQRRVLRGAHLRSALGFSLLTSSLLIALSFPLAGFMAGAYNAPEMATLLPVAMLSILFSGHVDLVTARARRKRRFNDLAAASLTAHLVAVPLATAAAFFGAGVWSLLILRLAVVVTQSVVLQWRVGFPLRPQLSRPHLADLRRMAGISSLDRLADNLTYLLFNNLVGSFFGLAVLGQVNMALRIVEPIRGALVATLHNLTFPHFRRAAHTQGMEADRDRLIVLLAATIVPVFAGLAAITPLLLPLVTGPGWEEAVPIAICLALGAALALPAQTIFTALLAGGSAEYALVGNLFRLIATALVLVIFRDSPPIAVGIARLLGDGAYAAVAVLAPARRWQWPFWQRGALLTPSWLLSGIMCIGAGLALQWLRPQGDLLAFFGTIGAGIAIQLLLMLCLQRPILTELLGIATSWRASRQGDTA